jgi:hypothetical protein
MAAEQSKKFRISYFKNTHKKGRFFTKTAIPK